VKTTEEGIDIVIPAGIAALEDRGAEEVAAVVVVVAVVVAVAALVVVAGVVEEVGEPNVSGRFKAERFPFNLFGFCSGASTVFDILFRPLLTFAAWVFCLL
jgi:hypothetical protein